MTSHVSYLFYYKPRLVVNLDCDLRYNETQHHILVFWSITTKYHKNL